MSQHRRWTHIWAASSPSAALVLLGSCWKESGQAKGIVPWVSVPSDVHLGPACSKSAFVACSLQSTVAPACSNPTFTGVICLMLSAASPPSSFPAALPPHLSLCSFSLYPEAEAALLSFPMPPACAASSSHHCYLWLTCAHTEGLFTSLLVIHRVWGALQMNRSHNCSLLEQPPRITSPCLHFCVSFTSSL